MNKNSKKIKRGIGQKIAFFFSILCYAMSLASVVFATYWGMNKGTESPIFASALACIFFFVCCGFVLQYISNVTVSYLNQSTNNR